MHELMCSVFLDLLTFSRFATAMSPYRPTFLWRRIWLQELLLGLQ